MMNMIRHVSIVAVLLVLFAQVAVFQTASSGDSETIPIHTELYEVLVYQSEDTGTISVGDSYKVDFKAVLVNSTHYKLKVTSAKVSVENQEDWKKIFNRALWTPEEIESYLKAAYNEPENYPLQPIKWSDYLPRPLGLVKMSEDGTSYLGDLYTDEECPFLRSLLYFTPLVMAYNTLETSSSKVHRIPASVYVVFSMLAYTDPFLISGYVDSIRDYNAEFLGIQVYNGVPLEVYRFTERTSTENITWRLATISPGVSFGYMPISFNMSSTFHYTNPEEKYDIFIKGYSTLDLKAFLGNPDIAVYKIYTGEKGPDYIIVYSWGSPVSLDYIKANNTISLKFKGKDTSALIGLISNGENSLIDPDVYHIYPENAEYGYDDKYLNNGGMIHEGIAVNGVHSFNIPVQSSGTVKIAQLDLSKNTLDLTKLTFTSNPSYTTGTSSHETKTGTSTNTKTPATGGGASTQTTSTQESTSQTQSSSKSMENEGTNTGSSGGNSTTTVLILIIVIAIGYWLYKRRA